MKWFCPYCWAELKGDERICPNCGKDIYHFTSLDFDEKLLYGLDNPIPENRMLVIEVIEKRKNQKAVPKLCSMLSEEKDTYELMAIVKALLSISTKEAIDCLKHHNFDKNTILRKFLEDHLNKY